MRVLVIGMADSVHLSRWLQQFSESDINFEVVSSSPHRRLHPLLRDLLRDNRHYRMSGISRYFSLLFWLADRFTADWIRGAVIAVRSHFFQPDLIHVCEFQNGGYAYLRSRYLSRRVRATRLLLTPYGSDLFWYQRFPRHRGKLQALLAQAEVLSTECERDHILASSLGFRGSFGPIVPASGKVVAIETGRTSVSRLTIAVKGYQNKWGRAKNALKAIEMSADILGGYRIEVFSCNLSTVIAGMRLRFTTGLDIILHRKGALTHQEMQSLFQRSKIYLALSRSDGLPSSLLEAMACGAVPVHSSTACIPSWLTTGVNGFFVDSEDIEAISNSITELMRNPKNCESISLRNKSLVKEHLSSKQIAEAVNATYRHFNLLKSSTRADPGKSEGVEK